MTGEIAGTRSVSKTLRAELSGFRVQ